MFFEGTEKKLEVVTSESVRSLRTLGVERWQEIVAQAGAAILSTVRGPRGDAHLLSESSLFVFDHRFVLITCGQTHLPLALVDFLRDVPSEEVEALYYERKNEVFPQAQSTGFFEDVAIIAERFPGRALRLGEPDEHHLYLYEYSRAPGLADPGPTLEILMYGLGEDVRVDFHAPRGERLERIHRRLRLGALLPGYALDDHLFDPVGYSVNGLRDDAYLTVHVTPQEIGSYASFETDHRFAGPEELTELVRRVVASFRPRSFDVVLFSEELELLAPGEGWEADGRVREALSDSYAVEFRSFRNRRRARTRATEIPLDVVESALNEP